MLNAEVVPVGLKRRSTATSVLGGVGLLAVVNWTISLALTMLAALV